MKVLEENFTSYILNNCPARTDEALMERFGISYNTLRKIEGGLPIRSSLAARLAKRVQADWNPSNEARQEHVQGHWQDRGEHE